MANRTSVSVNASAQQQISSTTRQTNPLDDYWAQGQETFTGDQDEPYKLDNLFFSDIVQYKCSCGSMRRLTNTYFCKHCMAIRCRSCVFHEVDWQYCEHCHEYIITVDPKSQMNKCPSCYQCPSCQHLLSTCVLSTEQQNDIVQRTCKFYCESCRWSSDTFITEGSKNISESATPKIANSERITELMDYYKAISQRETTDDKKRGFNSRSRNTMDLLKKYGYMNILSPKLFESIRARHNPSSRHNQPGNTQNDTVEVIKLDPPEARTTAELEPLDCDFYYGKSYEVEDMSSIEQRLAQIEIQPERVENFKPIFKSLSVKRSLRCKECERNICRSKNDPNSIEFKIRLASFYYIPELRLRSRLYPLKLQLNEWNIVEFTLQNRMQTQVSVKLEMDDEGNDTDECDTILPKSELLLGPKDDTEYKHVPFNMRPLNEETHIIFQSSFKLGFFIKIKPKRPTDQMRIRFLLSYDMSLNPKENGGPVRVSNSVQVLLGPVA